MTDMLMTGAVNSGGAALIGALVVVFVKRSLANSDIKNREADKKLNEIAAIINDLKVQVGVVAAQVEGLGKLIDRISQCEKRN